MKILYKEFTLAELGDFCKDAKESVGIYSSCFTMDYTIKLLKEGCNVGVDFEPILSLEEESHVITALYNFEKREGEINIKYLRHFYELVGRARDFNIERDVEDGYTFQNYDTAILTDKYLVLL